MTASPEPKAAQTDPKADMLAAIPKLRAFAFSLCGRTAKADDLVQETLMRAWAKIDSFEPGSNMAAWLYTILRNEFYSEFRKRKWEVADTEGLYAARLTSPAVQESHIEFQEFRKALAGLVPDHREALILIGASGMSYEEAAQVCGCAVGTMKSRVSRARNRLQELLSPPPRARSGAVPPADITAVEADSLS